MNANEIKVLEDALKVIEQLQAEIEYWKDKFNKAMELQEPKPSKYSDAWWKEVEEFNKQLREHKK